MVLTKKGRFGKWIIKVLVSYGFFIAIGMLLGMIPAESIGLSEKMFLNLRMFFMLLGPIYLTLIVKIVLTFMNKSRNQNQAMSERGFRTATAVMNILIFFNLTNGKILTDGAEAWVQSKGLRTIEKSKGYSTKGKRTLNTFLPVCLYILILEILTLLMSIVVFQPLTQLASNLFIVGIVLTLLLLLLVPILLRFFSAYRDDKITFQKKQEQTKNKAIAEDYLILESDPTVRKQYMHLPRNLFRWVCLCPGAVGILGVILLSGPLQEMDFQFIKSILAALLAIGFFSFLPLLIYWGACAGDSLVQRAFLSSEQFIYTLYSGSLDQRVEVAYTLKKLEKFEARPRRFFVRGEFMKRTKDTIGTTQHVVSKTLRIPRTFSQEQDQALLDFLNRQQNWAR